MRNVEAVGGRRRIMVWVVACLVACRMAAPLGAQDAELLRPGDARLAVERFVPFEAEYTQMGAAFSARLVRSGGERPVWSFQMVMETPTGGIGIDHVGHYVDDLGFAYRRFGFGAFRREYLDVSATDSSLVAHRLVLEPVEAPPPTRLEYPIDGPVFDGTFVYWLLGALPLEEGATWRLPVWSPTPDGVLTRESAPLHVVGRETVRVGARAFDAWVVVAPTGGGEARMWVVAEPPYLLRQSIHPDEGEPTTVIDLVRMR